MKSKDEILNHLATTVYSHGARKSIIGFLCGVGVDTNEVKFAERRRSAQVQSSATFADFVEFARDAERRLLKGQFHEMAVNMIKNAQGETLYTVTLERQLPNFEFQIGDTVKYIPSPDESSTEYVEAIAHGTDGEVYLCLSNGLYVLPCYCVKYKVQGEERRALIHKLNEVTHG